MIANSQRTTLPLFHFLFCELIEQCYKNHKEDNYIEALKKAGSDIGFKIFNLICARRLITQRPANIGILMKNIKSVVFKFLFKYEASNMFTATSQESVNAPKQYYHVLQDNVSIYLNWLPQNLWDTSSFIAGIIQGICQSCGLDCNVTSYVKIQNGDTPLTEFQVKIAESEVQRWKDNE